jgi:hypothetical protein
MLGRLKYIQLFYEVEIAIEIWKGIKLSGIDQILTALTLWFSEFN